MSVYTPIQHVHGRLYKAVVYIAGDYRMGLEAIKTWCDAHSDCWSEEPVDYVYTGGCEAGLKATRIHYPRFPEDSAANIQDLAEKMGEYLLVALHQHSCTVVGPTRSTYITRHPRNKDNGREA